MDNTEAARERHSKAKETEKLKKTKREKGKYQGLIASIVTNREAKENVGDARLSRNTAARMWDRNGGALGVWDGGHPNSWRFCGGGWNGAK